MTEDTPDEEELVPFLAALLAMKEAAAVEARQRDLRWFVMSFALLRRPRSEHEGLIEAVRTSVADPRRGEELVQMMKEIAATWEEELMTRGRAEGEIRALREALRVLLEERFGPFSEALAAQVAAIEDAERLRNALRQAVHVTTLQDLKL